MITAQNVSSEHSARYLYCSKKRLQKAKHDKKYIKYRLKILFL